MEIEFFPEWAELDEEKCPCRGSGWAEVDKDIWKECPVHYAGQLHPETRVLLLDEPERLAEEERRSQLQFKLAQAKKIALDLSKQLKEVQAKIVAWELELINRTPTRKMQAIHMEKFI